MNDLKQAAMEYEYEYEQIEGDEELDMLEKSEANFMYWSKMPFWMLDESIALLLAKNPEIVKWNIVRHYVNYHYTTELCSDYARLRTLILRAFEKKEIEEQNSPIIFLEWAEHKGIEIPKTLRQQVAEVKNRVTGSNVGTNESCSAPTKNIIELEDLLKQKDEEINLLKDKVDSFQKRIEELEGLV